MASLSPVPRATRAELEDLLREHRLTSQLPALRGEAPRQAVLPSGLSALDSALSGGFPRGQLSEVHGPASSGRTGLLLALLARVTRDGLLVAWVDPGDRLDPASASEAGADLERLLWLRGLPPGRGLGEALSATATLLGSGLFELLVLDLAGAPANDLRRLPATSFLRLERLVANTRTALVLLAPVHVAASAGGARLALGAARPQWSGMAGPARLLRGLRVSAAAGRLQPRTVLFDLHAL